VSVEAGKYFGGACAGCASSGGSTGGALWIVLGLVGIMRRRRLGSTSCDQRSNEALVCR